MRGYLWKRSVFAAVTIFVAMTVNFVLFRVLPGNAVTRISRVPNASPALKEALEAEFGLDKPIFQQYLLYLQQLLHGNLGISFTNRRPVLDNLIDAFGNTLPMVTIGTVLAIVIGIGVICLSVPVGLAAAIVMTQIYWRARGLYYLVVVSPVLTPGVILGISTVIFWSDVTGWTGASGSIP